jgi:hypothetical protein
MLNQIAAQWTAMSAQEKMVGFILFGYFAIANVCSMEAISGDRASGKGEVGA